MSRSDPGVSAAAEAAIVALCRRAWLMARHAIEEAARDGRTTRNELSRAVFAELRSLHMEEVVARIAHRVTSEIRRQIAGPAETAPSSEELEGEEELCLIALLIALNGDLVGAAGAAIDVASWPMRAGIARSVRAGVAEAVKGWSLRSLVDRAHDAIKKGLDVGAELGRLAAKAKRRMAVLARRHVLRLGGRVNKIVQRTVGIKRYTWRTVGDNRVRPEHVKREGRIFSWSDPPSGGHPGEDWMCRCWAVPVMS